MPRPANRKPVSFSIGSCALQSSQIVNRQSSIVNVFCRLPFRGTALALAGSGRAGFAGAAATTRRARAPRTTGADGVATFRRRTHGFAQPGAAELQEYFTARGGRFR